MMDGSVAVRTDDGMMEDDPIGRIRQHMDVQEDGRVICGWTGDGWTNGRMARTTACAHQRGG